MRLVGIVVALATIEGCTCSASHLPRDAGIDAATDASADAATDAATLPDAEAPVDAAAPEPCAASLVVGAACEPWGAVCASAGGCCICGGAGFCDQTWTCVSPQNPADCPDDAAQLDEECRVDSQTACTYCLDSGPWVFNCIDARQGLPCEEAGLAHCWLGGPIPSCD